MAEHLDPKGAIVKMKKMNLCLTLAVLIAFPASSLAKETKIVNTGPKQEVRLGDKLKKALTKFNPKFELLKEESFMRDVTELFKPGSGETPMAVSADLNGDTFPDYAFLGETASSYIAVAAIGKGTEWKIYKIAEFEKDTFDKSLKLKMYLVPTKAKQLRFKKDSSLSKRDGVRIEFLFGQSTGYYFDGSKMVEYQGWPI